MKRKIEIIAIESVRITVGRCPYCHREAPVDFEDQTPFTNVLDITRDCKDTRELNFQTKNEIGEQKK